MMKYQKQDGERNMIGALALGLGLTFAGLSLGACSDEASAEEVGEEVDDALDHATDTLDEAAEEVEDAVEDQ